MIECIKHSLNYNLERVLGLMNLSLKEIWYISPSRILRFQKTINITLKVIIVIEGPLVKMWWLGILKSPFFLVYKHYPLVWILVIIEYTKKSNYYVLPKLLTRIPKHYISCVNYMLSHNSWNAVGILSFFFWIRYLKYVFIIN